MRLLLWAVGLLAMADVIVQARKVRYPVCPDGRYIVTGAPLVL